MTASNKTRDGGPACIEPGCDNPAGGRWSPYWCQECDKARVERIGKQLEALAARNPEGTEGEGNGSV